MKSSFLLIFFVANAFLAMAQFNTNIDFRSQLKYPYECSSIWGYVDDNGNEYALVGTYEGVSIVDVTDPDNPVEKFSVKAPDGKWREIKTYNKHAYATNETDSGVLIIDLSNLPNSISHHE